MSRIKRSCLVGLTLACVVPTTALADPPTAAHRTEYLRAYHAVRSQFGPSEAGCNLIGRLGSCHAHGISDADVTASLVVLQRDLAPPPAAAQDTSAPASSDTPASSSGGLSDVPGVPADFAACVALKESTNGTDPNAGGNVYGIIPASGVNVQGASLDAQKQAFSQLYAQQGTAPWAPYDGC